MKKMLWQLPAVISGTAALTFSGVTVLQAAVNGPLQERGAIVLAERAIASERAQAAAKPASAAARATATAAVRPAVPPTTTSCREAACGEPTSSDVPGPAQPKTPELAADPRRPARTPAAQTAPKQPGPLGDKGRSGAGPAATQPGKGVAAGRETAPGQNRDADGRPAKAKGNLLDDLGRRLGKSVGAGSSTPPGQTRDADGRPAKANGTPKSGPKQSPAKGREQNSGNGQERGKGQEAQDSPRPSPLGHTGEAARDAARWLDRFLGLPEPPGLSGAPGKDGGPRR